MNPHDLNQERLVRHADGQLSEAEADQVAASLRHDPEARRFLRENGRTGSDDCRCGT